MTIAHLIIPINSTKQTDKENSPIPTIKEEKKESYLQTFHLNELCSFKHQQLTNHHFPREKMTQRQTNKQKNHIFLLKKVRIWHQDEAICIELSKLVPTC